MTLGYHSPLPPAPTGVADYAAALMGALERHFRVVPGAGQADFHLYQMGNNPLHSEVYARLLRIPGCVLLHDANLHHFYLGGLTRQQYVDEFAWQYGEWNRPLAEQLWENRAGSATEPVYFQHGMLKRAALAARSLIVHNEAAKARVRAALPEAAVHVVPHFFQPPPDPGQQAVRQLRTQLGFAPEDFVFGVFGHLRETKRLFAVLRAFQAVSAKMPRIRLLVAGDFVSRACECALAPILNQAGAVRVPHLPEDDFLLHGHAVDACLNLRYPSSGETSGIAIRLMGIGKPVILTENSEDFPAGTHVPVTSGVEETAMLQDMMATLAGHPELAAAIGRKACQHIREQHNLEGIAARIAAILLDGKRPEKTPN